MANTFIYALCEPGTRTVRYIGKANDPHKRLKQHLLSSVKRDGHLGNWLRSLSSVAPAMVILREIPFCQWEESEERYIRLAKGIGMRLTNATDGGEGQVNPTPETRFKIGSANRGKSPSEETRARIRASTSGKSNHNFGKPMSEESRLKVSRNRRGVGHSAETREKIRRAMKARFFSPAHRERISEGLRRMHATRKAAQL